MLILDVRRAHFYAKALRRVFIEMPREDPRWQEWQEVAELLHSLYGTLDAAANLEPSYSGVLGECDYVKSRASPYLFWSRDQEVRLLVSSVLAGATMLRRRRWSSGE